MRATWKIIYGACVGIGLIVSMSAGEVTGAPVSSPNGFPPTLPEPTTESPTTPNPGDEQPPRDPFTPYSIGPVAGWSYGDLTAAEQAVVDRGVDTTSWVPVHAAFDAATREQAHAAATQAAAITLGVADLASIGVVQ